MKALQKEPVCNYREFGPYLSKFTFPKSCTDVAHLFTAEKNAHHFKTGNFSCTGSEFLTLVPVIHRYFATVVTARGMHMDKVNSMLAVLEVVMLLLALKTETVTADQLTKAIVKHLVLFKLAWGETQWRPKYHYAIHLGPMLAYFGSCWQLSHMRGSTVW